MVLMDILNNVVVVLLGLVLGSFAGAQVWRLRARQLKIDKQQKEQYDKAEYAMLRPLMGRKQSQDRSQCLTCKHTLGAIDLIPVLSWVSTGGRCRYCKARIGAFEPLMEVIMALLFVVSYIYWPFGFNAWTGVVLFVLWLVAVVLLVVLAAYDTKWQLLPDVINISFIAVAAAFIAVRFLHGGSPVSVLSVLGAIGILAGLYSFIYIFSKGAWIGFGDVKLGVGLALLLGDWRLAFFALFLANLLGCIIVMPGLLLKRLGGSSRIAFGPLLIAGTLIAFWWGTPFVDWLFIKTTLPF